MTKASTLAHIENQPSDQKTFAVLVGSAGKAETLFESSFYPTSFEFPWNPDSLVKGNTYTIYNEMRKDDQVKAALGLKKNFVLCSGWEIQCEDEEIKKFVTQNFENISEDEPMETTFDDILRDMLSSYDYGFSLSEPIYKSKNGQFVLRTIKVRPPQTFLFNIDKRGNVVFITQFTSEGDLTLKPSKLLHHVYQPEYGNPYGVSDLQSAYEPYKIKKFTERFLAIYLERFAAPTIVGRARPGADTNETTRFLDILKSIQNRTELVIPDGMQIDFQQNKMDSSDTYLKAIDHYNLRISRSLLVPDLVGVGGAKTGGGSFALGKKHFEVFLVNIKFDRESLEKKITSKIVKPLVKLNFNKEVDCKFSFLPPTSDDLAAYAKIWVEAVRARAFSPSDDEINHFRKLLGFPEGEVQRPAPSIPESPGQPESPFDSNKIGSPTELIPTNNTCKHFRQTTEFEKKIDFKAIENTLDSTEKRIERPLTLAARDIYTDLIAQIRKKGLLRRFNPQKVNEIQPRFLREMKTIWKNAFTDLFVDSIGQAKKELFPKESKKFADEPLLPDEFIEVINAESFKTVGDYATNIDKKAKNIAMDAIKSGAGEAEAVALLREELKAETEKWLSTVVRTKTNEIFNKARRTYYENDPLAKEVVVSYEFSAILDDRTSNICRELDGNVYKVGDSQIQRITPPLHFNCRSLLVPVTRFEAHKDQKIPSLEKVQDLGGTLKKFIGEEIKVSTGKVENPGDTLVISKPGERKRIELVSITASNASTENPVNVAFKEEPDGNLKFAEFLKQMGGRIERNFKPNYFPLTDNVGFMINLSANIPVDYTIEYVITKLDEVIK